MKLGIDQFGPVSSSEADILKKHGINFVSRYLCYYTHRSWGKGMSKEEKELLFSKGFGIILNFEGDANHVGYLTVAQGTQDGKDIVGECNKLGVPKPTGDPDTDVAVLVSVDFDIQPNEYHIGEAYLKAVYDAVNCRVLIGCYGKADFLKYLHDNCKWIYSDWEPTAWSYGVVLPFIQLFQAKYGVTIGGVSVDENEIHSTKGFWMPNNEPKPIPKPSKKPVHTYDVYYKGERKGFYIYPKSAEFAAMKQPVGAIVVDSISKEVLFTHGPVEKPKIVGVDTAKGKDSTVVTIQKPPSVEVQEEKVINQIVEEQTKTTGLLNKLKKLFRIGVK